MSKFKVLDLFSGIGGFSLGLERAGMETVAFCEMDEHCQKVLKKHWPEVPIFHDVKKLKYSNGNFNLHRLDESELRGLASTASIDVICGGFPCQDISAAGQKKGIKNGDRSSLWKEFKRLIKEIKPRYAIIENVANLRNLGLNQVIKDLWSIGYGCEWHIISARSIGACHLRERIWIIAYPYEDRSQQGVSIPTKNKKESLQSGRPCQERASSVANPNNSGRREQLRASPTQAKQFTSELRSDRHSNKNLPDSNLPRLWKPFTSEEVAQGWWSETASRFSDWWKIESSICRMDDGLPKRLDKDRRERVKQLGNSVVPQIPELIGRAILEWEANQ